MRTEGCFHSPKPRHRKQLRKGTLKLMDVKTSLSSSQTPSGVFSSGSGRETSACTKIQGYFESFWLAHAETRITTANRQTNKLLPSFAYWCIGFEYRIYPSRSGGFVTKNCDASFPHKTEFHFSSKYNWQKSTTQNNLLIKTKINHHFVANKQKQDLTSKTYATYLNKCLPKYWIVSIVRRTSNNILQNTCSCKINMSHLL